MKEKPELGVWFVVATLSPMPGGNGMMRHWRCLTFIARLFTVLIRSLRPPSHLEGDSRTHLALALALTLHWPASFEHDRDNQNRQNVRHFDHRIDGGPGCVLVRIPNGVTRDGCLVRG